MSQKREETIHFEKIWRILNFPHTTHSWREQSEQERAERAGESRREQ
jgi:hypothetical protein